MILSVCPKGSKIKTAEYFQQKYLPCPMRITIRLPDATEHGLVLRRSRHSDGCIIKEAKVFSALTNLGLPVPEVLAGPELDPETPDKHLVAVYSLLSGINLQEMSMLSTQECDKAGQLLLEATTQLAQLTPQIRAVLDPHLLVEKTLAWQLDRIIEKSGNWIETDEFNHAIIKLNPILKTNSDPLIFTNGDYQPANFLSNGSEITGYLDFEHACYQDFLFGFVKYPIYDLHPLNKAGFIDHLLTQKRISVSAFAIRLALGCLWTLGREIPVEGGDKNYRQHVLALLSQSLELI